MVKQLKGSQLTCFYVLVLFDFSGPISCGEQLKSPGVHLGVTHGHFLPKPLSRWGDSALCLPRVHCPSFLSRLRRWGEEGCVELGAVVPESTWRLAHGLVHKIWTLTHSPQACGGPQAQSTFPSQYGHLHWAPFSTRDSGCRERRQGVP